MRKFALFVVISLCAACTVHNKPAANIKFSRMESMRESYKIGRIEGVTKRYKLYFTSDVDLLSLFKQGEGFIGARLICALEDDADFSVKHTIKSSMRGDVERFKSSDDVDGYGYMSNINFKETLDNGTTHTYLDEKRIRDMLSRKNEIPCKVVMTIYLTNPYYSNTMYVPVADILREVNR